MNIAASQTYEKAEVDLRLVIDTIPGFVWSARPDGSIEFLNQRGLDYTGLPLEQIRGWTWKDTNLHPDDRQGLFETWSAIVASGQPGEIQARLRRFDGEYRWFLFRIAPLRDESGRLVSWWGIDVDIDERKRAETLLAGEKRILELVARGGSLPEILDAMCRLGEELSDGALVSILLVSADGKSLRHGAAPNLPKRYSEAIDGALIGPCAGSCGTAVYRQETVVVSDIEADPLWDDYRHLALAEGLRACWSTPIFSTTLGVL